jgi:serine O-acetyltransferase
MSIDDLSCLAREFRAALDEPLGKDDGGEYQLPGRDAVALICRRYLDILFPVFFLGEAPGDPETGSYRCLREMRNLLTSQICHAVRFDSHRTGKAVPADLRKWAEEITQTLFEKMPNLARLLASDIEAAYQNDPAASSREAILLSYPYVEAIATQRLAHQLYLLTVPFVPRMMTEVAHSHTGIDINPGASIGESFFIDHGTGVVIGETSTIGNNVTLYHGVTLGAFNPLSKDEHGGLRRGQENKRHPDLEDHVTVYPNATILGGNTRVGHHSVIGGNVWLTKSVAPYSRVTVKDSEVVILNAGDERWGLYGGI